MRKRTTRSGGGGGRETRRARAAGCPMRGVVGVALPDGKRGALGLVEARGRVRGSVAECGRV